MNRKNLILGFLLIFFMSIAGDAYSQRRASSRSKRTSDRKEEKVNFNDKLNYEISIGNIGFSQGFNISFKPHVAYNFNESFSAGLALRGFYSFINYDQRFTTQEDISVFSYGPAFFGRFKVTPEFFLQAEYTHMIYDELLLNPNTDTGNKIGSPLLGGGYMSGYGPWKFGFQFLVSTNGQFQDVENVVDYWFSFSYNF